MLGWSGTWWHWYQISSSTGVLYLLQVRVQWHSCTNAGGAHNVPASKDMMLIFCNSVKWGGCLKNETEAHTDYMHNAAIEMGAWCTFILFLIWIQFSKVVFFFLTSIKQSEDISCYLTGTSVCAVDVMIRQIQSRVTLCLFVCFQCSRGNTFRS